MRGILGKGVDRGLSIAVQLLGVPAFLSAWGTELYGEWLVISAALSYITFSDAGFVTAARNEMAMCAGNGDREGAMRAFQSALPLVIGLPVAFTMFFYLIFNLLPIPAWLGLSLIDASARHFIILLMGPTIILFTVAGLLGGVLYAEGLLGKGSIVCSLPRIFSGLGMIIGALVGAGVVGASVGAVFGAALGLVVLGGTVAKNVSWFRLARDGFSVSSLKQLLSPSINYMALPFSELLYFQGIVMVLGGALGPAATVSYTTLRTVGRIGLLPQQLISSIMFAETARSYRSDDMEYIRSLNSLYFFLSCTTVVLWLVISFIVGEHIYSFWVAGKIEWNSVLYAVISFDVFFWCLGNTSLVFNFSTNQLRYESKAYVVAGVLFIPAALIGAKLYGVVGAALGVALVGFFLAQAVFHRSLRALRMGVTEPFVRGAGEAKAQARKFMPQIRGK